MQIQRVLIVHRKSLYQIYVEEHKERAVKRAIRGGDKVAQGIKRSHETHGASLARVEQTLRRRGIEFVTRWRAQARSARSFDLVISLGGDGTLLDTSRRLLDGPPLLGINSDPKRSVGALCSGAASRLPQLLDGLRAGELKPERLARLRIRVDGEEVLGPTLNDVLAAHVCPAGLSRFDVALVPAEKALAAHSGRNKAAFEQARGSGFWISTPTGSTAAIHSAGGMVMPPRSRRLQYLAREPYVAPGGSPALHGHGFVSPGQALVLICRLRRGMIWADGAHRKHSLTYGSQVVLDLHPVPLHLIRMP
jgi:NAD+ kinase